MRTLCLVCVLLLPQVAFADVVGPEPESCPPGSQPAVSHSGPYCAPLAECSADSACGEGEACNPIQQCVETRGCGGLVPPDAEPCTLENVVGPCEGDGSCATGECRTRSVCSGEAAADGGCGCRVGARRGAPLGGLALLALGLLGIRRARR